VIKKTVFDVILAQFKYSDGVWTNLSLLCDRGNWLKNGNGGKVGEENERRSSSLKCTIVTPRRKSELSLENEQLGFCDSSNFIANEIWLRTRIGKFYWETRFLMNATMSYQKATWATSFLDAAQQNETFPNLQA
jgi:hypothetical protein